MPASGLPDFMATRKFDLSMKSGRVRTVSAAPLLFAPPRLPAEVVLLCIAPLLPFETRLEMSFVNKEWHRLLLSGLVIEWFAKGHLDERFPSVEAAKLLAKDTGCADKFRRLETLYADSTCALTARMLRSGFLDACKALLILRCAVDNMVDLLRLSKLPSVAYLGIKFEKIIVEFPLGSYPPFASLSRLTITQKGGVRLPYAFSMRLPSFAAVTMDVGSGKLALFNRQMILRLMSAGSFRKSSGSSSTMSSRKMFAFCRIFAPCHTFGRNQFRKSLCTVRSPMESLFLQTFGTLWFDSNLSHSSACAPFAPKNCCWVFLLTWKLWICGTQGCLV